MAAAGSLTDWRGPGPASTPAAGRAAVGPSQLTPSGKRGRRAALRGSGPAPGRRPELAARRRLGTRVLGARCVRLAGTPRSHPPPSASVPRAPSRTSRVTPHPTGRWKANPNVRRTLAGQRPPWAPLSARHRAFARSRSAPAWGGRPQHARCFFARLTSSRCLATVFLP